MGSGSATQSIAGESDDFLDVPSAKALQNRITKVHIYFSGQIQQYFISSLKLFNVWVGLAHGVLWIYV